MLLSWVLENNLTTKMLLTHAFAWFILCCYCAYFCYVTQTMHTISHFRVSFIALTFFISRLSLHQSGPVTDWVRMAHPNIHSSQFFGPEFFVNWLPFNFVPESPRLNYSEAIVNFGRPSAYLRKWLCCTFSELTALLNYTIALRCTNITNFWTWHRLINLSCYQ